MLCTKLLVACDGSACAEKALEKAIALAEPDASIRVEVPYVLRFPEIPQ